MGSALHLFFLHTAAGQGALTGFLSAAAADVAAFRQWKSWNDATTYSWSTATFRWAQGFAIGALAGAGIGQL